MHLSGKFGERFICGRCVDGFDESTNTVYQYHGCKFHGHDCKENFYDEAKYLDTVDFYTKDEICRVHRNREMGMSSKAQIL